ncbi:hypothetical protein ACQZV8_20335 [Magnetococcales bacterium HHB-1]
MTAVVLSKENFSSVKSALRESFPNNKPSHLVEALAVSVGFRTYAALRACMKCSNLKYPEIILIDEAAFKRRLEYLSGAVCEDDFEYFTSYIDPSEVNALIDTFPVSAHDIHYKSQRAKAWRNMMVAGVNAGIEQKHFSLLPDEIQQPGTVLYRDGVTYDFTFKEDIPAQVYVRDVDYCELRVRVALYPTYSGSIVAGFAGFSAGEAVAAGFLEREKGAWLHSPEGSFGRGIFQCRRWLLSRVSEPQVSPKGFGDRG